MSYPYIGPQFTLNLLGDTQVHFTLIVFLPPPFHEKFADQGEVIETLSFCPHFILMVVHDLTLQPIARYEYNMYKK